MIRVSTPDQAREGEAGTQYLSLLIISNMEITTLNRRYMYIIEYACKLCEQHSFIEANHVIQRIEGPFRIWACVNKIFRKLLHECVGVDVFLMLKIQ